jgi:hypothetical protein
MPTAGAVAADEKLKGALAVGKEVAIAEYVAAELKLNILCATGPLDGAEVVAMVAAAVVVVLVVLVIVGNKLVGAGASAGFVLAPNMKVLGTEFSPKVKAGADGLCSSVAEDTPKNPLGAAACVVEVPASSPAVGAVDVAIVVEVAVAILPKMFPAGAFENKVFEDSAPGFAKRLVCVGSVCLGNKLDVVAASAGLLKVGAGNFLENNSVCAGSGCLENKLDVGMPSVGLPNMGAESAFLPACAGSACFDKLNV